MLLYTYISRFSVNPQHQQKRIIRQSYRRNSVPNHFSSRFSTSRTNGPRSLSRAKAGTHSALLKGIAHSGLHAETGAFRTGPLSLSSERSARSQTSPGRVSERCALPLLGLGRGHSRRTQRACGTAMRLCVSRSRRRRGPVGLRDLFQFGDVAVFSLCAQYFLNVRGRGVLLPSACFACSRNAGRPLAKAANLPFSEVGWSSLIPVAQKPEQHLTPNSPGSLRKKPELFFCVTSWSAPGRLRSGLLCRWRWGRTGRRPRPG